MSGEESVDLRKLGIAEAEGRGGNDAFHLLCIASTDDGCGDRGVMKRPGNGDDAGAHLVTGADGLEEVGYGQIASEKRLLIVLRVAPEVVCREVGDALFGHGSGEQAGVHRGIVKDADVVGFAEWEVFGLVGAVEHGVRRLLRGDRRDLHDPLHLRDREVGDADPTNFSFALQISHDGPALFDVLVWLGPVNLVEVDGFNVQTAEAVFALAANLFLRVGDLFFVVPDHGGLGENVGFVRGGLERTGYDLFGVAESVNRGGVDPVDAEVECLVDGGD